MHGVLVTSLAFVGTLYVLALIGAWFTTGWWFVRLIKYIIGMRPVQNGKCIYFIDKDSQHVYSKVECDKAVKKFLKQLRDALFVPMIYLIVSLLAYYKELISSYLF